MSTPAVLCQSEQSLLLVIDIQERLASAMPEAPLQAVALHSSWLLQAADKLNIPIVRTEQYPKGLGETLESLQPYLKMDTRLEKTRFSCCGAAGFGDAVKLKKRRQVILAGMETHVCVLQTAMELKAAGFDVFVVSDAVCARHKHNHKNALQRMTQAGIVITNTESVMFEWLRDARHPLFKEISKLLR